MRSRVLGLVILAACGGDSEGEPTLTSHDGVYTVDTWTQNSISCDAEGPSIADSLPPHFFIKNETFFGGFINLNVCPSIDECTADAQDDATLHIGQWGFRRGNDLDGWIDDSSFAFTSQDICQATRVQSALTFTGTTLRLEERSRFGTFAPTSGDCADDDAFDATVASPCEEFEVVTATFVAAF
jgi:hypothetical protein